MGDATIVRSLWVNLFVLLVLRTVSLSNGEGTPYKNVICYYHYMSPEYSGVTRYTIADIDPSICTHLVYFYTRVLSSSIQTTDGNVSHTAEWKQLEDLRLSNPSLKIILSVYDYYQSTATATYDNRQTFINQAKDLLLSWDFDGLEYLWYGDVSPAVMVLMEEVHVAFLTEATASGRDHLILMLTVMGDRGHIGQGVDIRRLAEAVDIFHVMTFGYSVSFASKTGLATPLYGNGTRSNYFENSVSESLSYYLDAGMTPEKLHMAVQLPAISFTLFDPRLTGVGAPAKGPGEPGEYTKVDGKLSYYEVCKRLQNESYTAEVDPEGLVNFAYKGDQWMTYEDPASLEIKMDYVYDHNLGGVAVWYLHEDDYTGQFCNQERYPLTSTLYRLASQCPSAKTGQQSQSCPNGWDVFPDPCKCTHYIDCVNDVLLRHQCPDGYIFDPQVKYCVRGSDVTCASD